VSFLPILGEVKKYPKGRTKQSFKDQTDINKIIQRAQIEGTLSHALKYPAATYGEFTGVDLLGAFQQVERARAIFSELPSEVRREFNQDAFKFAAFASDPANIDRLTKLMPQLAQPGRQFPRPGDAPIVTALAPEGASSTTAEPPPADSPAGAPGAAGAPSEGAPPSSSGSDSSSVT
jgi:hypothetical protein